MSEPVGQGAGSGWLHGLPTEGEAAPVPGSSGKQCPCAANPRSAWPPARGPGMGGRALESPVPTQQESILMALLGLRTKERPACGGLHTGCELQVCRPAGPPPQQLGRRFGKTRPPRNSQIVQGLCSSSLLIPLSSLSSACFCSSPLSSCPC